MRESVTSSGLLAGLATPPRTVVLRLSIPYRHALMLHSNVV
ncbi:MAG: hypothetical protein JWN89_9 [Parcubacteria group bacterium]|nr:hypothetical protein [Parcubacteria group bacterium]